MRIKPFGWGQSMNYVIRVVNPEGGGAVALRGPNEQEHLSPIFPDANVRDFALAGDHLCVLISENASIALFDLTRRQVVARARLPFHADGVMVAPGGDVAVFWSAIGGHIGRIDIPSLGGSFSFNLARRNADGDYDLIHRTPEQLRDERIYESRLPYTDAPLRKLRFSETCRPALDAKGRIVMPFAHEVEGAAYRLSGEDPITRHIQHSTVGVAIIDLGTARIAFRPLGPTVESALHDQIGVCAISPDGQRVLLHSTSLVPMPAKPVAGQETAGPKTFGRRSVERDWAHGLEVWDISTGEAAKLGTLAHHPFRDAGLMHPTTVALTPAEADSRRPEIDRVMPGLLAALSGDLQFWREGPERRAEDSHFQPQEVERRFRPGFEWVDDPLLFGQVMRRLAQVRPDAFGAMPWQELTNRQIRFMAYLRRGWRFHAQTPVMSVAWTDDRDRFVVIGRNGIVREISLAGGPGRAFEVENRPETLASLDWQNKDARLSHVGDRRFAVDYYATRFEFDLPPSADFGLHNLDGITPLPIRIITEQEAYRKETARAARLVRSIRPGLVTVSGLEPAQIIIGVKQLETAIATQFDAMVIGERWEPALFLKDKAIGEAAFCDILLRDTSPAAVKALDELLLAWLAKAGRHATAICHPDEETPTMGHVALTLMRLPGPTPEVVMRHVALRDAEHDSWTEGAWHGMELATEKLADPQTTAIRIRLAIQDIDTGNFVSPDFFRFYQLDHDLSTMRQDPSRIDAYAALIAAQLRDHWSVQARSTEASRQGSLDRLARAIEGTAERQADGFNPIRSALAGQLRAVPVEADR